MTSTTLVRAGAAALALSLAASSQGAPAAKPTPAASPATKGLAWIPTYEEALQKAKKEKKLILLDFYTDWCGWCKRLDADVFAKDSFIQAADGVLGVKVNAEKLPQLAQRFQVNSYPRLFFVNSDGVTVERIKGYLSLADFTEKVQAVKRGDTEYARLRDAAMDPTNLPAILRFAQYLSEAGQPDKAIEYWQQVHDLSLQQLFQNPSAPGPMSFHRQSLLELGRGYTSAGLDDAARRQYEEVLRVYPDDPMFAGSALIGLARVEMKHPGGHAKARAHLDRVIKEYPGTPNVAEAMRMKQSLATTTVSAKPPQ